MEANYEIYTTEESTYEDIDPGFLVFEKSSGTDVENGRVFATKKAAQDAVWELERERLIEMIKDFVIIEVQVFPFPQGLCANVAINSKDPFVTFMIQLGTNGGWSVPRSDEACWDSESDQDTAHEMLSLIDADDLARLTNAQFEVDHCVEQLDLG